MYHRTTINFYRNLLCLALFAFASTVALAAEASKVPTLANLQATYAVQSATQVELTAYAAQADKEGYKTASALFRAAAKSKSIHLPAYEKAIKAMGAEAAKPDAKPPVVKTTKENLEAALKAETEVAAKYAEYMKQAEVDKKDLKDAAAKTGMFMGGDVKAGAELIKLYKEASENLDKWKAGDKEILVCTVCSFVSTDLSLKQCPVCSVPREKFESFK